MKNNEPSLLRRSLGLLGLLALLLVAAPASASDPNVVKIVSSLPRTGSANAQTTTTVNGIRMALEEFGYQAGPFKIVYEDWDDASAKKGDWDPEVEAANADKAIADPDVLAYIGTYNSGAAKISMPILNRASLPMISPANTYTGLTKPGLGEANEPGVYRPSGTVNYFRVVPADDIQGKAAAEWMTRLGGRTVYVLDDRGLYGKGIADVFVATAPDFGLRVLGREGMDPKAQEYRSLMTKIKALDPDFVYFGGTTQSNAGQIAKDMVAVGLRASIMAPDGCFEEAFIQSAGQVNVEGRAYVTFGGVPPAELRGKGAEFVKKYRAKYGAEPEGYAVYGYVAAKIVLQTLEKVGVKDRKALRDALAKAGQDDDALGTWQFDANGDTTLTTMSGSIVKSGKFQFATLLGVPGQDLPQVQSAKADSAGRPLLATVLQQLLLGLTTGMVFALIALGYTMVYGILEFINFAHGDVFMLAGFLALTCVGLLGLHEAHGIALALGLLLVVVTCTVFAAVLNVAVDRLVYKPLRKAPKLAPLVSAIGVSFILQNVGLFWGALPMTEFGGGGQAAAPKSFPNLLPTANLLGDSSITLQLKDVLVMSSSLVVMVLLFGLVKYTKLGKAMRATAQDPQAARLMGIDVDKVVAATFLIGGGLAGFAAVVYSLYIGTIHYQMGYQNGLYAFTAAVVGGIGSIPGAVLGGILLGLLRAFSDQFIGAQWQPAVLFGILIVILVFRPAGLLGKSGKEKV
jgi:branched-chain amino acid transport system substrate-binding protein